MSEQSNSFIEVFSPKIYENIRKEIENDYKINELFCAGNGNKLIVNGTQLHPFLN